MGNKLKFKQRVVEDLIDLERDERAEFELLKHLERCETRHMTPKQKRTYKLKDIEELGDAPF